MTDVPKHSRVLYKITFPVLMFVTVVMLYAIFLATWPFPTVDVTEPIKITNQPVAAGSLVEYEVHQCRHTDANARVIRRLVSQDRPNLYIPLGATDTKAPTGCYTFKPPAIILPEETPPGSYKIEFSLNFEVNPLQTISKTVFSEEFKVIESVKQ